MISQIQFHRFNMNQWYLRLHSHWFKKNQWYLRLHSHLFNKNQWYHRLQFHCFNKNQWCLRVQSLYRYDIIIVIVTYHLIICYYFVHSTGISNISYFSILYRTKVYITNLIQLVWRCWVNSSRVLLYLVSYYFAVFSVEFYPIVQRLVSIDV